MRLLFREVCRSTAAPMPLAPPTVCSDLDGAPPTELDSEADGSPAGVRVRGELCGICALAILRSTELDEPILVASVYWAALAPSP